MKFDPSSNRWHSLYVGPGSIDLGGLILSNTNGTLSVSAPGAPATPIAGEDTWVRAQANASFNKANSAAQYDANTTSTGSLAIPIGTTAQRPASAANGQIRYNTTLGRIEAYLYSAGWTSVLSDQYTVEYLIVAGGGAGAGGQAGEGSAAGGGAGGLLQGSLTVNPQVIYTVTVGAGGSSGPAGDAGNNGSNSSAFSQTAIGGGKGSQGHASGGQNAGSGGSGGGGGYAGTTSGSGTPGQGYPGGNPGGATGSSGLS